MCLYNTYPLPRPCRFATLSIGRLAHSYHSILREPRTKQAAWVSPQILEFQIQELQTEKVSGEGKWIFLPVDKHPQWKGSVVVPRRAGEKCREDVFLFFDRRGRVNQGLAKWVESCCTMEIDTCGNQDMDLCSRSGVSEPCWHLRFFGKESANGFLLMRNLQNS